VCFDGMMPRATRPPHKITLFFIDEVVYKHYFLILTTAYTLYIGSATTAEMLRGPLAGLGAGCGRGSPPPAVRVRGITFGKFLKTQMLNPAFW